MKKIGFMYDSTGSVDKDFLKENDIYLIRNSINDIDGNIYIDECTDEQKAQICELMIDQKIKIKTSLVNKQIIKEAAESMLKKYEKVIYISIAPTFSGQYNNAIEVASELNGKFLVVHSNSTAIQSEIVLKWAIEYVKEHKDINQEKMQSEVIELSKHITTMFTTPNWDGLISSGRVPVVVAKTLKLAKMFPVIAAEETNQKERFYRKWTEAIPNLLDAIDKRFNKPPRGSDIKEIYLCQSICTKDVISNILKQMANHFKIKINEIKVRTTPLCVMVTTLSHSFGMAILTSNGIIKNKKL